MNVSGNTQHIGKNLTQTNFSIPLLKYFHKAFKRKKILLNKFNFLKNFME